MLNPEDGKDNGKLGVEHAIINMMLFDVNYYERVLICYYNRGGEGAIGKQQRRIW